jgi:hypothetical protein
VLDELEGKTAKARKEFAEDWVTHQLLLSENRKGIIGWRVERLAKPVNFERSQGSCGRHHGVPL